MEDLSGLTQELNTLRMQQAEEVGRAKAVAEAGKELAGKVEAGEALDVQLRQVSALFRSMSEERQTVLRTRIEGLVSLGLKAVFEEPFEFKINMVPKADQITANLTVLDSTGLETDILGARGGGVAAVVGVLLQLVMLTFLGERSAKLLFLDESFAHLSDEYVRRMAMLLKLLTEKLKLQVVLVTHQPEFMEFADKAYKFTAPKGITKVEELK